MNNIFDSIIWSAGIENSTIMRRQFILNFSLLLLMINKCDICGFIIDSNARYCGGCNVDLREPKEGDGMNVNTEEPKPAKKKTKASSNQETSESDNVINWCVIRAMCNSFDMTFAHFFYLILILARGDKKIGFCDCTICNQGYRQLLADMTNTTDKKKLTAQSREIVIRARGEKINGIKYSIPDFLEAMTKKGSDNRAHEKEDQKPQQMNNGKIVIEIDPSVLENAVFAVLKSERGQEAIRSIPRKKTKIKAEVR